MLRITREANEMADTMTAEQGREILNRSGETLASVRRNWGSVGIGQRAALLAILRGESAPESAWRCNACPFTTTDRDAARAHARTHD